MFYAFNISLCYWHAMSTAFVNYIVRVYCSLQATSTKNVPTSISEAAFFTRATWTTALTNLSIYYEINIYTCPIQSPALPKQRVSADFSPEADPFSRVETGRLYALSARAALPRKKHQQTYRASDKNVENKNPKRENNASPEPARNARHGSYAKREKKSQQKKKKNETQ